MKVSVNLDAAKLDGSGRDEVVGTITEKVKAGYASGLLKGVSLYFVEFPCGVWLGTDSRLVSYSRVQLNCASDQADFKDKSDKQKLDFAMSASCNCNLATAEERKSAAEPSWQYTEQGPPLQKEKLREFTKELSWNTFGLRLLLNLNIRPRTTDLVLRFGRTAAANTLLFEVVRVGAGAGAPAADPSKRPSVREDEGVPVERAKELQYLAPKRGKDYGIAHIQFQILETLRTRRVSPILLSGHDVIDWPWRLELKSRTTVSLDAPVDPRDENEFNIAKAAAETIGNLGDALKLLDPRQNLPRGFRSTVAISDSTSETKGAAAAAGKEDCRVLTKFILEERKLRKRELMKELDQHPYGFTLWHRRRDDRTGAEAGPSKAGKADVGATPDSSPKVNTVLTTNVFPGDSKGETDFNPGIMFDARPEKLSVAWILELLFLSRIPAKSPDENGHLKRNGEVSLHKPWLLQSETDKGARTKTGPLRENAWLEMSVGTSSGGENEETGRVQEQLEKQTAAVTNSRPQAQALDAWKDLWNSVIFRGELAEPVEEGTGVRVVKPGRGLPVLRSVYELPIVA
eukprot:g17020.t1